MYLEIFMIWLYRRIANPTLLTPALMICCTALEPIFDCIAELATPHYWHQRWWFVALLWNLLISLHYILKPCHSSWFHNVKQFVEYKLVIPWLMKTLMLLLINVNHLLQILCYSMFFCLLSWSSCSFSLLCPSSWQTNK